LPVSATPRKTVNTAAEGIIDEVDLGGLNDECVYPKAKPTT